MVGGGRRLTYGLFACLIAVAALAGPLPASAAARHPMAAAPPGTPTPCDSQFHSVQGPIEAPGGGYVSMAAASPNDIWAVGGNTGPQGNGAEALHWDGGVWNGVAVPASLTGGPIASFTGVTTVPGAAGNVWAVGNKGSSAFAAQWNGTAWTVFNLPMLGRAVGISAVVAISANDVWAVGTAGFDGPQGGFAQTMIDHYDGTTWSVAPSPSSRGWLRAVAAASASDIWAVGTLIEHWDGASWSAVAAPAGGDLFGVATLSASSAWAVGSSASITGRPEPLTEHWNGSSWSIVPSPSTGYQADQVRLRSVAAVSATNVWASGSISPQSNATLDDKSLVEHWNGVNWSIVPSLGGSTMGAAVVAPTSTEVWTGAEVGYTATSTNPYAGPYPFFERLCINPPIVDGVNPVSGNASGATVTLTGSGFTFATGVNFGGTPATDFKILSDSWISATAPPQAAGTVDVTVANPAGTSAVSQADLYIYVPPAISWHQYSLFGNDGVSWQPIDSSALRLTLAPGVDSNAMLSANADLWTALAGVNQDLGIFVSGGQYGPGNGTLVGWKESGGNAGTFSPNAAFVQTVVPLKAGITYSVTLEWKANHPTPGLLVVAAGIDPNFSPTRLTAELVPATDLSLQSAVSSSQYQFAASDGSTWWEIDSTTLAIRFRPQVNGKALLSANADLWTQTPGVNQDLGIAVLGGSYAYGQIVGWKESGGSNGTFSPNAAYLQASADLVAGIDYTIQLRWKSNFHTGGTIRAGAGASAPFSPTRLTLRFFPSGPSLVPNPNFVDKASTQQYSRPGSNGNDWSPIDTSRLAFSLQSTVASVYLLSGNADLWTANQGVNQDLGIFVSGGAYGTGTLVAWKESGGRGGTFSPNAAYVQTVIPLTAGAQYTITLEWKANHANSGTIYAGAGTSPTFSPTSLTAYPAG